MGFTAERSAIQTDSLDDATRVALWNSVLALLDHLSAEGGYDDKTATLMRDYWMNFAEKPTDTFTVTQGKSEMRQIVLRSNWSEVLDLVEFVAQSIGETVYHERFVEWVGGDFKKYLVGYRLIDDQMVPVSDPVEVSAIEEATATAGAGARVHLQRANQLLSNRSAPQYAKVIAEAIGAVESCVFDLTGEKVLSAGLKKLDGSGHRTHPALVAAWDKLYGYTSDAAGIRHGLVRDEDASEPLAVYFLVSCSAFINLLLKQSA